MITKNAGIRASGKAGILFLFFFLLQTPSSLSTLNQDSFGRHAKWFLTDPYHLFFKTKGGYAASQVLTLGISGLLMIPEDSLRYGIYENYSDTASNPLSYVNYLGDDGAIAMTGTWYGIILLMDDAKFQDAAFTSLQSIAYAQGMTNLYRFIFGRVRPDKTDPDSIDGNKSFEPFSGNSSFPSGHATTAFAMVTPWFMYYPRWYTGLLFVGAAGTTVARMGLGRHWSTDVLAGAGVGFFTGYFLSRLHQTPDGESFTIFPRVGRNSAGLTMSFRY